MSDFERYIVVDDDSTNNLICDFNIRKFDPNAKIDKFRIPEDALMFIKNKYSDTVKPIPTILFLDVNMPTMSGFEFLDQFNRFQKEIRDQFTIYILSSSIEDFELQAKQYPVIAGFLSKPLKTADLEKIRLS